MLCARSFDVTACFFVCKYHCFTLSRKNKFEVRDSKVRNNRFCQIITIWSHFLKFQITYYIEVKFSPSYKKMTKTSYNVSKPHSFFIWWRKSHVNKFSHNDKVPLCCIVHVHEYVLIGKLCLKPFLKLNDLTLNLPC